MSASIKKPIKEEEESDNWWWERADIDSRLSFLELYISILRSTREEGSYYSVAMDYVTSLRTALKYKDEEKAYAIINEVANMDDFIFTGIPHIFTKWIMLVNTYVKRYD